jgi:dephospho-CoA kinase
LYVSYERARQNGSANIVLEAIHRISEAEYVHSLGGIVIGIDADLHTRFNRISKRQEGEKDNVTFEQFVCDTKREDEGETGSGPNIRAVLQMADSVIQNEGSLPELYGKIDSLLETVVRKQSHSLSG